MRLEIACQDRVGIAQKVLAVFVEHNINVRGIEFEQASRIFISFHDVDFTELQNIMPKLRLIDGVEDVKTANFMPFERERNELETLIKTFPDLFISIDGRGNIHAVNKIAASVIGQDTHELAGESVAQWIKGFSLTKWLEQDEVLAQTTRLKFLEDDYVADMLPIYVEGDGNKTLAGAVLMLKSEARLGQQMTVFKQTKENSFASVHASSGVMRKVIREAKRMSSLDNSILIQGETGTGKELLARACHGASTRGDHPFIVLNCAAFPDESAESELFGIGDEKIMMLNAVYLNLQTVAPYFWMKSAKCLQPCKTNYCA